MVTQLRDRHSELKATGGDVVVIGMGWPEMASHFKAEERLPFTLLVDQERKTYRALGLKRGGVLDVAGPRVWRKGLKSLAAGNKNKIPKQDPMQLGGAVVVGTSGRIAFFH